LLEAVAGRHLGITRHQLLLDPAVPYTSHNSSACIVLEIDGDPDGVVAGLTEVGELYLPEIASPGADVGFCVAEESKLGTGVILWGRRAKVEVLQKDEAEAIAHASGIYLRGLTGEEVGVVGALAAVGLRRGGDDGRFLELGGLRRALGEQPAAVFLAAGVERFVLAGEEVELAPDELIVVGQRHAQPVLLGGRATLMLDPGSERGGWKAASRETVREY
jgi:hypothetical protein